MVIDWIIALGALTAVPAFLLSLYNLNEQRKSEQRRIEERKEDRRPQVKIRTSKAFDSVAEDAQALIYKCDITNIGLVGVTISLVVLEHAGSNGGSGPALQLPDGDQPRKLDSGESQTWSIRMNRIPDKNFQVTEEIPVVVVARDTAGNEHRSEPEETLPLHGTWGNRKTWKNNERSTTD